MAAKRFGRLVLLVVGLSILLAMWGCATTAPSEKGPLVIQYNPWKQRKGTAGMPAPDPGIGSGDRRFQAIQGTFEIPAQEGKTKAAGDWVLFDGNGNFECGPQFHPHALEWSDGPPQGYLVGFYVVDGGALRLAFCEGSFAEARYPSAGSQKSISTITFNRKTYRLEKSWGAPSAVDRATKEE